MYECITKPLTSDYSGCLVEKPLCEFAVRLGFSYLCEHPKHKEFFENEFTQKKDLDHNKMYRDLRESRRTEYIAMAKKFIEDMEGGRY